MYCLLRVPFYVQFYEAALEYRNMFSKYKSFLAIAEVKDAEAKDDFAKWEHGWQRCGLTEFEASVCEVFHNAGSTPKKKFTAVDAAHTRIVDFWAADPSKAVPAIWAATQEAIKWVKEKASDKKQKATKKSTD